MDAKKKKRSLFDFGFRNPTACGNSGPTASTSNTTSRSGTQTASTDDHVPQSGASKGSTDDAIPAASKSAAHTASTTDVEFVPQSAVPKSSNNKNVTRKSTSNHCTSTVSPSNDGSQKTCAIQTTSDNVHTPSKSAEVTVTQSVCPSVSGPHSLPGNPNPAESSPSEKPFTDVECISLVQKLFTGTVHNKYVCQKSCCGDISYTEKKRINPKKFHHNKLNNYWWLCYLEEQGMYCMLCKKHNMKHTQNKRDVFVNTPSTRFLEDAMKVHASSSLHKSALQTEMVQKVSVFHKEISTKEKVEVSLYEKVFHTVYFLMKNFMSNRNMLPLLDMIETVFDQTDLKFYQHRSAGAQQEIFIAIGDAVKDRVTESAKNANAFGLLTDEVADISVTEQLMTFIQFFNQNSGKVQTSFLSCENILEDFDSANAEAISKLLLQTVKSSGLDIAKLTGFSSDGASVMTGKKGGVAALLRKESPNLINVHCVCHRLALSCNDSNESTKYIKEVEQVLRQLWTMFENSPKKMATYLKIQLQLKNLNLSKGASKSVATRLKKSCRTRWLSLDAAVTAVYNDFEALLQTLDTLQTGDATALGLLKKMRNIKFLGTIYVLKDVLPVLSNLSRVFQRDSFCFSSIVPEINSTKDKLDELLQENAPLAHLQSDIDSIESISDELTLPPRKMDELQSLFQQYVLALKANIDRRFADTSHVISAFSIFDPTTLPSSTPDLKEYGNHEMETLADHFYKDDDAEEKKEQLLTEWRGIKYHLRDFVKQKIPQSVLLGSSNVTSVEWCLLQLLSAPVYRKFFPNVMYIAEVAASLPVTNAWPERGASALKNLKTKSRNRLQANMLQALLQVSVNGPDCHEASDLIKTAVKDWLNAKDSRKLVHKRTHSQPEHLSVQLVETSVQTENVFFVDQSEIRQEIDAALKALCLEGVEPSDSDSE